MNICRHKSNKQKAEFSGKKMLQCLDCGLIFVKDDSNKSQQLLYKDYYQETGNKRFRFGIEYLVRMFRFLRATKIFLLDKSMKSILDIGSGRGYMLYYLKKYFFVPRTVGTQISVFARDFSRQTLGLEIFGDDLLEIDFGEKKFDVITMCHVLEHVDSPEEYIKKISLLLNEEGLLVVDVPNFNSWTRRFSGKHWFSLDLDFHKVFFTYETLSLLLEKHGFKIVKFKSFSLEYATFISAQSIANRATKSDNNLFGFLQSDSGGCGVFVNASVFFVVFPLCFIVNLMVFFAKKGEILYIVAKKK